MRFLLLALAVLACLSTFTGSVGAADQEQFAPGLSARDIRLRVEEFLGRPVKLGETVLVRNADLGLEVSQTQGTMGRAEEASQAPGCNAYFFWFANYALSPCNLYVISGTLTDPDYPAIIDNITFNLSIPPGWAVYGTFPVQQCGTHWVIRYYYLCGAGVPIVQEMDANYGPYGFLWNFKHVQHVRPLPDTLYALGPDPLTLCLVPYVDSLCASPPDSLVFWTGGGNLAVPALSWWGLAALLGILLLVALRHIRARAGTASR